MAESRRRNTLFLWPVAGLVILHLLFFIYSSHSGRYLVKDSYEYLQQARNIMEGYGWYSGDPNSEYQPHLQSRRPPVYAFFISIIREIFNYNSFILVFQNILSIINILGLFYLLKKFKLPSSQTLIIFPLLLFFPSQFIFSNMIMAEILFQAFIFWSLICVILFLMEGAYILLWLHVVFVSLAILTKPVLYLFWLPEILFFIFLFYRKKIRAAHVSLSLLPLLVIILLSYHNKEKTGYFHYSSMKATNLIAYNTYQTLRLNYNEEEADNIINNIFLKAKQRGSSFKEYSEVLESSGLEIIRSNWPGYLFIHVKGMVKFFLDPGRHDLFLFFEENFNETEKGLLYHFKNKGIKGALDYIGNFSPLLIFYIILIYVVNLFLIVSLIFFFINKNVSVDIKIIMFLIIAYLASVTGPIGSARFKVAVYPCILFTVPFFINYIKNTNLYKKFGWH